MAFPATNSSQAVALEKAQELAGLIKERSTNYVSAMQADDVSANVVLEIYRQCINANEEFNEIKATPGIAAYAQEQFEDIGLDIVAEFNTMIAAIDSVVSWISTNFPDDGTYILKDILTPTGVSVRTFTPGQTAGLRDALTALIATID